MLQKLERVIKKENEGDLEEYYRVIKPIIGK